jgi:hypothetical protein
MAAITDQEHQAKVAKPDETKTFVTPSHQPDPRPAPVPVAPPSAPPPPPPPSPPPPPERRR